MEQLNNLDVFFLIIVGISALVGIARGFTKELLSLLGWVVAGAAVYFLTPAVTPIMKNYISSEMLAGFVSGLLVLLTVCVFWVLAVDKISSSIRQSKLSPLDRIFGLAFGVLRGAVVVVLLVMMISALIPEDSKKGIFASSKMFVASEEFVEPLKSLIPQETMDSMQAQMEKWGFGAKKVEEEKTDEEAAEENKSDEAKADETEKAEDKAEVKKDDKSEKVEKAEKADKAEKKKSDKADKKEKSDKPKKKKLSDDADEAFIELVQPKIEGEELTQADVEEIKSSVDEMSNDLKKLMDALEEQTISVDSDEFGL